ncbi:hypothetical protein V1281_002158 [Nitrobacteraceae bacterium AZCC 2161]|jgi:hypothetical protein
MAEEVGTMASKSMNRVLRVVAGLARLDIIMGIATTFALLVYLTLRSS